MAVSSLIFGNIVEVGGTLLSASVREVFTWGVLVSCGCCNKLPQTWWLKTIQIYSLTVLEAGSLKSVLAGHPPSRGFREEFISLPVSGACSGISISASVFTTSLCGGLMKIFVTIFTIRINSSDIS